MAFLSTENIAEITKAGEGYYNANFNDSLSPANIASVNSSSNNVGFNRNTILSSVIHHCPQPHQYRADSHEENINVTHVHTQQPSQHIIVESVQMNTNQGQFHDLKKDQLSSKQKNLITEKRKRHTYTKAQLAELEREYLGNKFVHQDKRKYLATLLKISEYQVKIWFQNRRRKDTMKDSHQREFTQNYDDSTWAQLLRRSPQQQEQQHQQQHYQQPQSQAGPLLTWNMQYYCQRQYQCEAQSSHQGYAMNICASANSENTQKTSTLPHCTNQPALMPPSTGDMLPSFSNTSVGAEQSQRQSPIATASNNNINIESDLSSLNDMYLDWPSLILPNDVIDRSSIDFDQYGIE